MLVRVSFGSKTWSVDTQQERVCRFAIPILVSGDTFKGEASLCSWGLSCSLLPEQLGSDFTICTKAAFLSLEFFMIVFFNGSEECMILQMLPKPFTECSVTSLGQNKLARS